MMRWVERLAGLLLSPGALLAYAALLALPFVVAHLAGWREYTGILSGTLPSAGLAAEVQALLGLGYAAAFMVATILAPVFALAAGGQFIFSRLIHLCAPVSDKNAAERGG